MTTSFGFRRHHQDPRYALVFLGDWRNVLYRTYPWDQRRQAYL